MEWMGLEIWAVETTGQIRGQCRAANRRAGVAKIVVE